MKAHASLSRSLACLCVLSACGVAPELQAAALDPAPTALAEPTAQGERQPTMPAECQDLHRKILELDEVIASHPEVRAVRDAYDGSELGQRERAAVQAMSAEGCFMGETESLSARCTDLMEEIETCAATFENSPAFKRVTALPEIVAFDQLSERFADLCAASMPGLNGAECPWLCEDDEVSDEEGLDDSDCDASDDEDYMPSRV